ncbi:MAG: hypothetical protein IKR17_03875 [Bacteroidales bacterium]|nr:hypothetical protein [Bacteroidales bacterium]
MKSKFFLLTLAIMLNACSESTETTAKEVFNEAVDAYMNKQYNKAKVLLDSVIHSYPQYEDIAREAHDFENIVYRSEQERTLHFLDSLLLKREDEIKTQQQNFVEVGDRSEVPIYVHKTQTVARTLDRSTVRGYVDRNGTFYIASCYTGERHINHTMLRVAVGDDYITTDTISNDALNHSFENGGQVWETVKYKYGSDNGAAEFIARNYERRIVLTFGGGSPCTYVMNDVDKQALRDTYYLALMLRETVQIKSQIRNVKVTLKNLRNADNSLLQTANRE